MLEGRWNFDYINYSGKQTLITFPSEGATEFIYFGRYHYHLQQVLPNFYEIRNKKS